VIFHLPLRTNESREAVLFIDAGVLKDALQAEFPDASFVEGTAQEQISNGSPFAPHKSFASCEILDLFGTGTAC